MAISLRSRQCIIRRHPELLVYIIEVRSMHEAYKWWGRDCNWGRERAAKNVCVKSNLTCDFCSRSLKNDGSTTRWAGQPKPQGRVGVLTATTQARLLYISKGYSQNSQSSVWETLLKLQWINNPRSDNLYMASLPIHGSHVVESLPHLLED